MAIKGSTPFTTKSKSARDGTGGWLAGTIARAYFVLIKEVLE
jgi:hypothetical protein